MTLHNLFKILDDGTACFSILPYCDEAALKVTDKNGESLIFEYVNGEIKERG